MIVKLTEKEENQSYLRGHITIRWAITTNMINLEKNKIIVLNRTKMLVKFSKIYFFWYEKFYPPPHTNVGTLTSDPIT